MKSVCLFLLVIVISMTGCANRDLEAFEKAKQANSEKAYLDYVSQYPKGRYVSEAKELASKQAVVETIAHFKGFRAEAIAFEQKGNWKEALDLWTKAKASLRLDENKSNTKLEEYKKEAKKRIGICSTIIDNPISIDNEKVSIKYRYKSSNPEIPGKHITSVNVGGSVTNNCPFAVYNVVIGLDLKQERAFSVNTKTGEEESRGGSKTIASVERMVSGKSLIEPGKSKKFFFSSGVTADTNLTSVSGNSATFFMYEPVYSIELKSYKAKR